MFNDYCLSFNVSSEAPFILSGDKLANLIHQNKKKSSKSRGGAGTKPLDQFNVTYCGSMKVKIRTPINAKVVDGFVSCLSKKDRPTSAKKYKKWRQTRKRSSVIPTATKAAPVNSLYRPGSLSDEPGGETQQHVTEQERARSASDSSNELEHTSNDDNNGRRLGGERDDNNGGKEVLVPGDDDDERRGGGGDVTMEGLKEGAIGGKEATVLKEGHDEGIDTIAANEGIILYFSGRCRRRYSSRIS